MIYCIVEVVSETASFRDPEFQNFHRTYRIPPPSTVVGMAGAALGRGPKAAQDFFSDKDKPWSIGIAGYSKAVFKDLWKYRTLESNVTSILTREILFRNHFFFAFGHDNEAPVQQLAAAFKNPVYALTTGQSDSLAKIKAVHIHKEGVSYRKSVANCWIPGNIVQSVLEGARMGNDFSIYTTAEPTLYDLPLRFNYQSESGVRSVSERKEFSLIGEEMQLNFDVAGIQVANIFIPVFDYGK